MLPCTELIKRCLRERAFFAILLLRLSRSLFSWHSRTNIAMQMQQQATTIEQADRMVIKLSFACSEESTQPEPPPPPNKTAKDVKCPVSPQKLDPSRVKQESWHFHSGGVSDSSRKLKQRSS